MDNLDEARLLEIVLKAGALPAPVEIVEQRSVGPSLGRGLHYGSGLLSSVVATLMTMVSWCCTTGRAAPLPTSRPVLHAVPVWACWQRSTAHSHCPALQESFSRSLSAVDANVLIYERIREEHATGKTLRAAIDAGYISAWTAIIDSNLTTFITRRHPVPVRERAGAGLCADADDRYRRKHVWPRCSSHAVFSKF